MSNHPMRDDQDPTIRRLFAEQDLSLAPDDFMLKLGKRIDRLQRARRAYRTLAMVACLLLSTLSAPWIAQITSTLIELAGAGVSTIGPRLYVPLTWLLVGATVAGCSPIIYLWRTGRW
jgi:hypothetical protein